MLLLEKSAWQWDSLGWLIAVPSDIVWQQISSPHRVDWQMIPNDREFESKAADLIDLYLNSPDYLAVFCVDKKTAARHVGAMSSLAVFSPAPLTCTSVAVF